MVYGTAKMPPECSIWNCRWLVNDAGGTSRPDRSHIVIDLLPDFVTLTDDATGQQFNMEVIQCWCNPAFPDAHRDPAFRAYVAQEAEQNGRLALIRYNARDAFTLIAPVFNGGEWLEKHGGSTEHTHTPIEIFNVLTEGSNNG